MKQNASRNKQFYSVEEIRQIMGISRATAYTLAKSKNFPAVRVGARILIPTEQFHQWIEASARGVRHGR